MATSNYLKHHIYFPSVTRKCRHKPFGHCEITLPLQMAKVFASLKNDAKELI